MNKTQQNKRVKVQITYEWEFDMKDWMDLNAHEEKVKEIMKQNFEWDAVNAFHNLRNITYPRVKGINIEQKRVKAKSQTTTYSGGVKFGLHFSQGLIPPYHNIQCI